MKTSLQWLNDYVSIDFSARTLADKLTMAGLEVESWETVGGDTVFELEVTPNRADCLNMIGLAREIAAVTGAALRKPSTAQKFLSSKTVPVEISDKDLCSRYIGTLISGVQIKSAPLAIRQRLGGLGVRAVNNVVDITNFSLLENGQPLHAFDYDQLAGGKIIVRRAGVGETLLAIDGNTYTLDPSILVIADVEKPVAIAGIMGGKATEVTAATKTILLESACFDPVMIRRAARKLALSTDSSYRFERGIHMDMVEWGARRATALILESAGGEVVAYQDCYPRKLVSRVKKIRFSLDGVNRHLGSQLKAQQCRTILKRLEFKVNSKTPGSFVIEAPGFRRDIHEPVDVYEEIARMIGFDHLPEKVASINAVNIPQNSKWQDKKDLRHFLMGLGCDEILTYSLTCQEHIRRCRLGGKALLKIRNPLSADYDTLRPAMLATHVPVIMNNVNRGQKNLKFFEIGKIYDLHQELDTLGLIFTGSPEWDWRQPQKREMDFFDLKGVLAEAFSGLGVRKVEFVKADRDYFALGESAEIWVKNQVIGAMGRVADAILRDWNYKGTAVYSAEVCLGSVFENCSREKKFILPSEYPTMTRDLSLALAREISFHAVAELVEAHAGEFLRNIQVIEEYVGEKISAGMRGLVFSLQFQSTERTLTDEEVSLSVEAVRRVLIEKFGAVFR